MIIQSKKTGVIQNVPLEQWKQMKKRGDARKYDIVDNSDDNVRTETIDIEAIDFNELQPFEGDVLDEDEIKAKMETDVAEMCEQHTKAELLQQANELGIIFKTNTNKNTIATEIWTQKNY